jgi:hypothetical protein
MMNTMIGASIFAVLTFSFPVANANMALAQTAQDRVLTIGKPEEVGMSKSVLNAATSLYSESGARGGHVQEDSKMSSFDFGVQFLDPNRMTYWGKHRDANFWIENASIDWSEADAPFHTIARLTLLPKSHVQPDAAEAVYFDVTGNSTPDSTPLGSVNRARWSSEVASRKARMRSTSSRELYIAPKKAG